MEYRLARSLQFCNFSNWIWTLFWVIGIWSFSWAASDETIWHLQLGILSLFCWLPSSDCWQVTLSLAEIYGAQMFLLYFLPLTWCNNKHVYILSMYSVFLDLNFEESLHNRYYHTRNFTCQGERWNTGKMFYSSLLLLCLSKLIA